MLSYFGSDCLSADIIKDKTLNDELAKQLSVAVLSKADLLKISEIDIKNKQIGTLDGIEKCYNLEKLVLINCGTTDISKLSSIRKLKHLSLTGEPIQSLDPLKHLTNLEFLLIDKFEAYDLTALSNLKKLKELRLSTNKTLTDIHGLENLTNLESLGLSIMPIRDITPLSKLTNLKTLSIIACDVDNLDAVAGLVNLELLLLLGNRVTDITPLNRLQNLKALSLSSNLIADVSVLSKFHTLEKLHINWNPLSSDYPKLKEKIIANNPGIDLKDEQRTICNSNPITSDDGEYIAFQTGLKVSGCIFPYLYGDVKVVETTNDRIHSIPYSSYTIATAWTTQDNKPTLYYATAEDNRMQATTIRRCYFDPDGKLVYDKDYCLKFEPFFMSHLSVSPDGNMIIAYKVCENCPKEIATLTAWNSENNSFVGIGDFFVMQEIKIGWFDEHTAAVLAADESGEVNLLRIEFDTSGKITKHSTIEQDCQYFWGISGGEPLYNSNCQLFRGSKLITPADGILKIFISGDNIAIIRCDSADIYNAALQKILTSEFNAAHITYCYSRTANKLYGPYKSFLAGSSLESGDLSGNIFSIDAAKPDKLDLVLDLER